MASTTGVEKLARAVSRTFDRRSPIAFTSEPDSDDQRIVELKNGALVAVQFDAHSTALSERDEPKTRLRRLGHVVADVGCAMTMTPALRAAYASARRNVCTEMGLDLPRRLAAAFIKDHETPVCRQHEECA